jgi:hypothetical protein
MGSLTWCAARFANGLDGREKLLVHKSMEVGENARLHVLDLLWGNI